MLQRDNRINPAFFRFAEILHLQAQGQERSSRNEMNHTIHVVYICVLVHWQVLQEASSNKRMSHAKERVSLNGCTAQMCSQQAP